MHPDGREANPSSLDFASSPFDQPSGWRVETGSRTCLAQMHLHAAMRWTANPTADALDCLQRYHRDARDLVAAEMEIGLDVKQKDLTPDHAAGARATRRVNWFRGGDAQIDIEPMPVPPATKCANNHANNHAPHNAVDDSRRESTTARWGEAPAYWDSMTAPQRLSAHCS